MSEALNITIAAIPKGRGEELRVQLKEYKGSRFADLRIFAEFAGPSDAKSPTKAGVTLSLDKLPALARAVAEAEERARALGLIALGSPSPRARR